MIIENIDIKNYRSIKKISIKTEAIADKNCFILLGINEAGKSNILKAINLVSKDEKIIYNNDCLKSAQDAQENISISFDLKIRDSQFYIDGINKVNIPENLLRIIKITKISRVVSFDFNNLREDSYIIEVDDNSVFSDYIIDNQGNVKLITDIYTGEEKINNENISTLIPTGKFVVDKSNLEQVLSKNFNTFEEKFPKVNFWAPNDDKYLINKPINLNQFAVDQTTSIPLRNIFKIADREDVAHAINRASQSTENRLSLQQHLSESITEHIHSVWPHKVSIRLQIEQDLSCSVFVEDEDDPTPKYSMSQRSDGFRQLVSILLSLSVENKKSIVKNQIILLDEPEVHLHPSGVKYLREELLNISKNNLMFVSSHSIYMVDRKSLNRHFKIERENVGKKSGSVTKLTQVDPENPYQEEVLYEALGTSVYEHIKPFMLVFEGRIDKDLFDAFTNKFKMDIRPLDFGSISSESADKMPTYAKFFDGKLVKGTFILDADQKGKSIKANIIKDNQNLIGNVFELSDFVSLGKNYYTIEDLLPDQVIIESLNELYKTTLSFDDTKPVLEDIKNKLKELHFVGPSDNLEGLKSLIAEKVLSDLSKKVNTRDIIKTKYPNFVEFIEKVHSKIKE